ncbi:RNA-directed DNA polymerase, eukaryota, reverse transcriptase zinc-binding domain protein [Tanacetum coccineum]
MTGTLRSRQSRVVEDKILWVENGALATLWNSWVPKKVNIFIWRALKGRLPVREELGRRGIDLDSLLCPCCNNAVESCNHSLILCNFAMSVWEKVFNWWRVGNVSVFSIGELFSSCGNVFIPNTLIRLWQAGSLKLKHSSVKCCLGVMLLSVRASVVVLSSVSIQFLVPAISQFGFHSVLSACNFMLQFCFVTVCLGEYLREVQHLLQACYA